MWSFDSHFRHFAFLYMLKNSASHPAGISNRKTSFRAQVYKQTNSFCAWKLILACSKLSAACWTGRARWESPHLSGRGNRWWASRLTFQQSQKQIASPWNVFSQPHHKGGFMKTREKSFCVFLFSFVFFFFLRKETKESSGVLKLC